MKVAVYGKSITEESRPFIEGFHQELIDVNAQVIVFNSLDTFIKEKCNIEINYQTFEDHQTLIEFKPDYLVTIGGDGTILDAVTLVRDSGIPILGINTGRLGFLANVSKENIRNAMRALKSKAYVIDERNLIRVDSDQMDLDLNFAMNEITVSRKDTTAMVTVKVWINDEFLNSYWADGLIVATPTGSTGYSLSCGGPIIMPGSQNFVITPIAPHNLNVRPFVIPNSYKLRLKVEGREPQFLVSLDSRIYTLDAGSEIELKLENFKIKMIETEAQSFTSTLRNKLLWGLDKRN